MTAATPLSLSLACRAETCIPGGANSAMRKLDPPLVVSRTAGAHFYDEAGRSYLDFHCAFGPTVLGHNHPAVIARVVEAISSTDLMGVGVTPLEIELAEKLAQHVPCIEKVLLCNSGTEATYHAIRLARAVTGREKVVKFQGGFHGTHDALAMNVITPAARMGTRHLLSAGMTPELVEKTLICDFNDLDSVADAIGANPGEIAAVILEPILHNVGCVLPEPGFMEGLRRLTTENGIVLVFDEVVTGFRHSLGGYQAVCGVRPDLTTLGKAMASGFPIAALGGRADLMDRFNTRQGGDVLFAGTYNGHPASCAAALATIAELERPGAYARLFGLGERMRTGLREIMTRRGVCAEVAGFGSVFVTYFLEGPVRSYTDLLRNDDRFFVEYRRRLIAKGIFKLPVALKRNHTNLSQTDADIDDALAACDDTIREMTA